MHLFQEHPPGQINAVIFGSPRPARTDWRSAGRRYAQIPWDPAAAELALSRRGKRVEAESGRRASNLSFPETTGAFPATFRALAPRGTHRAVSQGQASRMARAHRPGRYLARPV